MYLVSTVLAVTTGLLIVNTLQPGKHFLKKKLVKGKYASKTEANASGSSGKRPRAFAVLVDIVPQNFMKASTNNKNMLQVIFLPFFGIAMLPNEKTLYVKGF